MFKPMTSEAAQAFAELEARAQAQLDREQKLVRGLMEEIERLDARERSFVRSCWSGRAALRLGLSDAQYQWACDLAKRLEIAF
jgi:hypothetical protein